MACSVRKTANVVRRRAIFAELDGGLPDRPWPIEPSMLIESSPGKFHAAVVGRGLNSEEFRGIERRMVRDWGSDKGVIDEARVLRLPGFLHQKTRSNPHLVRMVSGDRQGLYAGGSPCSVPPDLRIRSVPQPNEADRYAPRPPTLWIAGRSADWRSHLASRIWEKFRRERSARPLEARFNVCCDCSNSG